MRSKDYFLQETGVPLRAWSTQEANLSANAHTLQEAWTEKDKPHTPSRGKVDFGTPPFSASKIDSLPGGSHRQTKKQTQKNRTRERDRACGCCCACACFVCVCVDFGSFLCTLSLRFGIGNITTILCRLVGAQIADDFFMHMSLGRTNL